MIKKLGILLLFVAVLTLNCNKANDQSGQYRPPSTVTTTRTETLKAAQYMSISFSLNSGELVEGSFAVQGPTNLDIKFAIQDPDGKNVYGPVRGRSGIFTYRAERAGLHCFFVDNTYSLATGKIVRLTYSLPRR